MRKSLCKIGQFDRAAMRMFPARGWAIGEFRGQVKDRNSRIDFPEAQNIQPTGNADEKKIPQSDNRMKRARKLIFEKIDEFSRHAG